MTEDQKLANRIESEGSYERAQREAQAATIALNVARWQQEQAAKAQKRQADYAEAARRGLTLSKLKELRREQWQLRNCRATIQEIVKAHKA